MKIVDWSKKIRGKSKVAVISGEDGDLYAAAEGGIPLRIRDLIKLYYDSCSETGKAARVSYLLGKADQKWLRNHKELLNKMGLASID